MEEQSNVISDVNPIDIPNVLKTEVKDENCPSHYIKYEVVKGKAMKIWQCGICMCVYLSFKIFNVCFIYSYMYI